MAEAVNITLKSRLDPKGFDDFKSRARQAQDEIKQMAAQGAKLARPTLSEDLRKAHVNRIADQFGDREADARQLDQMSSRIEKIGTNSKVASGQVFALGKNLANATGASLGPVGELGQGIVSIGVAAEGASVGTIAAMGGVGLAVAGVAVIVNKAVDAFDKMTEAQNDAAESAKALNETESKLADTVLGGVAKGRGMQAVNPLIARKQALEARVTDPDTEEAARIVAKREIDKLEKAIAAAISGEAEATGTANRVSEMDKKTGNAAAVAKARLEKQVMEAPTSSIPQVQSDLERAQGRLISADVTTEAGQRQATEARQAIESAKEILEILNRKLEKEKEIQRALESAGDAVYEKEKEQKAAELKGTAITTGLASASARIGGFNSAMGYVSQGGAEKTLSEVAKNTAQTAKNTTPRPAPTNASPLR